MVVEFRKAPVAIGAVASAIENLEITRRHFAGLMHQQPAANTDLQPVGPDLDFDFAEAELGQQARRVLHQHRFLTRIAQRHVHQRIRVLELADATRHVAPAAENDLVAGAKA